MRLGLFGGCCKRPAGWRAMGLQRAPLWLVAAVLASFVRGGCCCGFYSLRYSYLQLPEPSQGRPQFFIWGYLDGQPIAEYASPTRKMEPLVPWMEEVEKEAFLSLEWVFRARLEELSKLEHPSEEFRAWQVNLGCELREDGSKGGFLHYGYNGRDFISFNTETLRWKAAQPQAQKVKETWEEDPGGSEKEKAFLEETCIERLQRYLSYMRKTPQKIKPPVGNVTRKMVDDSLEVLICQAFGFYPKEIQATWTRDGEVCKEDTFHRNVAPNSDGTHYVQLSIEIDPKERDHFRCHLEHEGLQEPLDLAWKEETATTRWDVVGVLAAGILGAGILFLIGCWWRCRKKRHREETTCADQVSSPPSAEEEIQSQAGGGDAGKNTTGKRQLTLMMFLQKVSLLPQVQKMRFNRR